jgi:hypothetical protein
VSFMRSTADFGNNIITTMDNIAVLVRNFLITHYVESFWEKWKKYKKLY